MYTVVENVAANRFFCYKSMALTGGLILFMTFRQHSNEDVVFNFKFYGDIEVDESRFGRRSKNNIFSLNT